MMTTNTAERTRMDDELHEMAMLYTGRMPVDCPGCGNEQYVDNDVDLEKTTCVVCGLYLKENPGEH